MVSGMVLLVLGCTKFKIFGAAYPISDFGALEPTDIPSRRGVHLSSIIRRGSST